MRRDHRFHLVEMYAAIDAFEQNAVHFTAQRRDIGDQLNLPFGAQFLGELIHARVAGLDIRTAALVGRDDARAWNIIGRTWIIENLGECDDVGSIGADDAQTYLGAPAHDGEDE